MTSKVKILYLLSGVFLIIAISALITPATFQFIPITKQGPDISTIELEINNDVLEISNFIGSKADKTIYTLNNDIKETYFAVNKLFLIHTLKASKCSSCSTEMNFLLTSIDNEFPDLKQIVWVFDYPIKQILDLVKSYSINETPIIVAQDSLFNQVLNYENNTHDRNLIFAKRINKNDISVQKRLKIPYNFNINVSTRDKFIETITNIIGDYYENEE